MWRVEFFVGQRPLFLERGNIFKEGAMKQAKSKFRYIHAGFIVAAVLAILGSCEGGWGIDPDTLQIQTLAPVYGEKEGDMVAVKIKVPTQNQSGSRSVDTDSVQFFANFFEVIFRKQNVTPPSYEYWRGAGTAAQGYISVAVPVFNPDGDDGYDVLLLAGIDRTLLGAGYLGKNNSTPDPVKIKAGIENIVSIPVTAFPPQWNTAAGNTIVSTDTNINDFEFVASLGSTYGSQGGATTRTWQ